MKGDTSCCYNYFVDCPNFPVSAADLNAMNLYKYAHSFVWYSKSLHDPIKSKRWTIFEAQLNSIDNNISK